jgi:hypothetical protein
VSLKRVSCGGSGNRAAKKAENSVDLGDFFDTFTAPYIGLDENVFAES